MELRQALELIKEAVHRKEMLLVIGECFVQYQGRAGSKLPKGKRMLLIKGDGSFAVHQNRFLNPVNYMVNSDISSELNPEGTLIISARKRKPKELLEVFFYDIDFIKNFDVEGDKDLRLFGSEKELSQLLMQDLSFIEPGLKPINNEIPLRKGIIDILAEDEKGRLVVIEVKRRKADLKAVSQLQLYVKQIEKIKGKETRGILCAPDIARPPHELLERYGLEYYKLDYEISNPKARIKGLQKKQKGIMEFVE